MADTGNPNFATNFRGRYELTHGTNVTVTNKVVMLDMCNNVQLLGNFTVKTAITKNGYIATIPADCRPQTVVRFPASYVSNSVFYTTTITVNKLGAINTSEPLPVNALLMLNGASFCISSNFYQSTI